MSQQPQPRQQRDFERVINNGLNIRHVKQTAELCRLTIKNNP